MFKAITDAQSINLTEDDVQKIAPECHVRAYEELNSCETLDEAMGQFGACIVLYETSENYGHWCCFFRVDSNTIEFFDSYALRPDKELEFVSPEFQKESKQGPRLTELIEEASKTTRIIYNQVQLQSKKKGIDTCGRWTALRVRKRKMPLASFQQMFNGQPLTSDFLVTAITMLV